MAESNMPDFRDIHEPRDLVTHYGGHAAQSRMKQQCFVISHQEMTEFQIDFGNEHRDA